MKLNTAALRRRKLRGRNPQDPPPAVTTTSIDDDDDETTDEEDDDDDDDVSTPAPAPPATTAPPAPTTEAPPPVSPTPTPEPIPEATTSPPAPTSTPTTLSSITTSPSSTIPSSITTSASSTSPTPTPTETSEPSRPEYITPLAIILPILGIFILLVIGFFILKRRRRKQGREFKPMQEIKDRLPGGDHFHFPVSGFMRNPRRRDPSEKSFLPTRYGSQRTDDSVHAHYADVDSSPSDRSDPAQGYAPRSTFAVMPQETQPHMGPRLNPVQPHIVSPVSQSHGETASTTSPTSQASGLGPTYGSSLPRDNPGRPNDAGTAGTVAQHLSTSDQAHIGTDPNNAAYMSGLDTMSMTDGGSQMGDEPPPPYSGMPSRNTTMRSAMQNQRRTLLATVMNNRDVGSVRSARTMQTNATMDSTSAAALTADGFQAAALQPAGDSNSMPAELDAKSTAVDADTGANSVNAHDDHGLPQGVSELEGSAGPVLSELDSAATVADDRQTSGARPGPNDEAVGRGGE